jgi:hypothetical protein
MCKKKYKFLVFNYTFNKISAISWRSVLVVEEAGVPSENHRLWGVKHHQTKKQTYYFAVYISFREFGTYCGS